MRETRCLEGAEVLPHCQRKSGRNDPRLLICFRVCPCEASPNPWPATKATTLRSDDSREELILF